MENVKNGKEKQKAYAQNFDMLKKAMNYHFYLEAVSITYAIMEDRMVSFLHYAGIVTRNRENLKINQKIYPYMRELTGADDNRAIRVKNISVKLDLISRLLTMSEEQAREIDETVLQKNEQKSKKMKLPLNYMQTVYHQIDATIDRNLVEELLSNINKWRDERNQLIHALLNKTVDTSEAAKKECAESGCQMVRSLDNNLVKKFKTHNNIRKCYRIQ